MALTSTRPLRKTTGGRYKAYRKKRVFEKRNPPILTKVAERKAKTRRTVGNNKKMGLLSVDVVNVYDPKSKKYSKIKIKTILENTANRHFVRRNILTKGAIIETELGKAKVTSRPGQEGTVNAILVK
jgi:small subunit ribosomal protein S8e